MTASALSFPPRTCPSGEGSESMKKWMLPASTSPIAGAALRIDGAPARPLPVVIEGLPRKVVEVRVERDGFAPWTRSLDLAATPDLVLDVALDAEPRARP